MSSPSINVEKNKPVPAGLIEIGQSPDVLQILGLGSCVAVTFYSPEKRLGALAHVMLPSIEKARTPHLKGKYADSAIPALVKIFQRYKVHKSEITVKIVGGSHMFPQFRNETFDIGNKNIEAIKKALQKENLLINGRDVGGTKGRSLNFFTETGKIYVFNQENKLALVV